MFWFRSRPEPATPKTPHELWRSLHSFFEDEEGLSYAGNDVGFDDLAPDDVERLWDCLRTRATSIGAEPTIWDRNREDVPDPPELDEAVRLLAHGNGIGYVKVSLEAVESKGVRLPELSVELWPDALSMYWWVGEWDATTAAALVELLGELRALVPHARLAHETPKDAGEFWGPVQRYLAQER